MKSLLKIFSWLLVITLFVTLIVRMVNIPSAFSSEFVLVVSIFYCLLFVMIGGPILTGLSYFLFKKRSFGFIFRLWASLILISLHIYFYSPPLKITIPNDFSGEINLIVDLEKRQNLNINENGIGYIKESILHTSRADKKPRVFFNNGTKVKSARIIGYDSIFFYGRNTIGNRTSLTFKILPNEKP